MIDLSGMTFRDLLDAWPIVVTALQSAAVRFGSWASPRFAQLQSWAKIALLFVAGFLIYLVLGLGLWKAGILALVGAGAAALIYYFGRKPTSPNGKAARKRQYRPRGSPSGGHTVHDEKTATGSPPIPRGPVQG